jgi:CRP/FNR family cyclic AMP-dependent transcriptional regulator
MHYRNIPNHLRKVDVGLTPPAAEHAGAQRMSGPEPIEVDSDDRKLRYLKATELFRDFTLAQLEPFHHTIRMETCPTGHVFYRPGETGEGMFLLKEGRAQLYRLAADGRKFVFAEVPPSSMFGEMSCVGQAMYECFAEATEDSVICTLTRSDVQRLIVAYPQFAMRLIETMGRRIIEAERQLEDLAFKTVVPRLAAFLHRESRDGMLDGLSHQDIAERLGIHRETVTYALNELKAAGIIEIGRRRIRLLDAARLAEVVDRN